MKILRNINVLKMAIKDNLRLGFVPTMGGLHKGHISLIKKSQKKCSRTLVSIYVNPKQFNNKNDYVKYPRNLIKDMQLLKKLKIDYIFIPKNEEIYSEKRLKKITLKKTEKILCAKFRKGHFEGVLDIMDRFIKLIKPQYIFLGEKDFQQLFLIKNFIKNKYKSIIIPCKT
ncbi:pantoate--beta-alanine ligase, partial [bacterium]|nr:pantoate--beta-alanine ligase [bacterium]